MNIELIFSLVIFTTSLFTLELGYFSIARKYKIIDKPNERSSHDSPVIRGGGIIFLIAILLWFVYEEFAWPWFLLGIAAASLISLADDIRSQPARIRISIHIAAMVLVFYSLGLFSWPIWLWLLALVISIGALNAFNFMDGINGITGVYSLVMLLTFMYIQRNVVIFTIDSFLVINILSVMVFLFFNFRKKARCFAGDVGSVTMAFVLIFLLLQLIYGTNNLLWVLLFLVYGLDAVVTIIFRLRRKENIFQPHRTHLYQYLCNELGWQHRSVALIYGVAQAIINALLIVAIDNRYLGLLAGLIVGVPIFYLVVRGLTVSKVQAVVGRKA